LAEDSWIALFDTSSWIEVGTEHNPRVFDVPVPLSEREAAWTANLIEHLCKMEDERYRLRSALETITAAESTANAHAIATTSLAECYHTWLVNMEVGRASPARLGCPVCRQTRAESIEP
jgi:hypothetical protein